MNRPVSESLKGLIETTEGPTFVRTRGSGPPVVIVHGGPGFTHEYLVPALKSLRDRCLVFYDQLGCGRTPRTNQPLTIERCFVQLRSILEQFSEQGSVGVIAHSWGSLVVAGAMAASDGSQSRRPVISEGLLINPMPISSGPYEDARRRLVAMIPLSTRLKVPLRALLTGDGAAVMRLLLPFYMCDPTCLPADAFGLDLKTYRVLDAQLKGFDLSAGLADFERLSIIRGSHEFASLEDIAELVAATRGVQTIENAGHFPFWEAPKNFERLLRKLFGEGRPPRRLLGTRNYSANKI